MMINKKYKKIYFGNIKLNKAMMYAFFENINSTEILSFKITCLSILFYLPVYLSVCIPAICLTLARESEHSVRLTYTVDIISDSRSLAL